MARKISKVRKNRKLDPSVLPISIMLITTVLLAIVSYAQSQCNKGIPGWGCPETESTQTSVNFELNYATEEPTPKPTPTQDPNRVCIKVPVIKPNPEYSWLGCAAGGGNRIYSACHHFIETTETTCVTIPTPNQGE